MNRPTSLRLVALVAVISASACAPPDANRAERVNIAYLAIVAAEDARPTGGPALQRLLTVAETEGRFLRSAAVRALGRLENPDLAGAIEGRLSDPAPGVRAEAANALAQAHFGTDGTPALQPLLERAEAETDPHVLGTLAASIGRLLLDSEHARVAADALVDLSLVDGADAPPAVMQGVALGLDALARSTRAAIVPGRVAHRLGQLRLYADGTRTRQVQARVRAISIGLLGSAGLLDREQLRIGLRDESSVVKAAAARQVRTLDPAWHDEGLRMVMFSRDYHAQIEGLRFLGEQPRTSSRCGYLLSGAPLPSPELAIVVAGLRVLAIDALAEPCPDLSTQRSVLADAAEPAAIHPIAWQPAAHALVALASIDPAGAADVLPGHATHSNPFVRTYAARAAGVVEDRETLRSLLTDPAPNVRAEALRALSRLDGRGAHAAALDQLSIIDPQLIMIASAALEGSTDPSAARALLDALDRMSAERRETFRDARRALLERLAELGAGPAGADAAAIGDRLVPYLSDYDPLIADLAAETLRTWSGRPYFPTPLPPDPLPLPGPDDLEAMATSTVVLHMEEGGEIHIELHPYAATTNTWRFYRQVRDGYFDGLTFHRWAPNFVIQGGSPNANEYFGDGPFTRDEVGLHHWRGTVGISTRGHDTGDGQIFVNILDNPRLDHQYTIVGTVTEGLEVVDRVNEGGVIVRAEVRPTR